MACFWFSICLGALILIAFNSMANRVRKRITDQKLALENFLGFKQTFTYPVCSLSIVYASFGLLYMLSKQIYSLSIKIPSKVLLNLTFVITSLEQLMRSNLVCCFPETGSLLEITRQAEKNTTLNRLFTEKSALPGGMNSDAYPNNCVFRIGMMRKPIDMTEGRRGKTIFVKRLYAKSFLKKRVLHKKPNGDLADFWESPTMLGMVSVNYFRKGLDR